jgi:RES domain-containing protein
MPALPLLARVLAALVADGTARALRSCMPLRAFRWLLPKRWRESPSPAVVQRVGDQWVSAEASAVLQVPSTIIESEHNFILNVRHPDFNKIKLGRQMPYTFDPRLLKK